MTKYNRIILVALMMVAGMGANAQNGINSPYSRYGFGMLSDRSMGFNKGMSGVAQGFRDGQIVNVQNPASYSAVDSMTALFDLGLTLQNANMKMGNIQKNTRNTSLDYLAMHFRATKNVGIALGMLPISNIRYNMASSTQKIEGTEDKTYSDAFNGDGGLHEVFLGAGWRPIKPISIGFNAAYIYGDYNHTVSSSFSESGVYSSVRSYKADIQTYSIDFGIQYIQSMGKEHKIVVGADYTLGHNVNNEAYRTTQTINSATIESSSTDTISNAFQMPTAISAGVTYYFSDKLQIGIDAELQKWSNCRFPNNDINTSNYISAKGQLYDRKRIALGGEYTPNKRSDHFFSRVTYKFGTYYAQSYANADPTGTITDKPQEYGLSAGVSLPIYNRWTWRNSPKINVSVQWTHSDIPYLSTSNMKQGKLSENYLRLCVGLTFSECWFYKWKVQ